MSSGIPSSSLHPFLLSQLSLEGIASLPFFAVLKYLGLLDVLSLYYVCQSLNKSVKQFAKENTPQSVAFVALFNILVGIRFKTRSLKSMSILDAIFQATRVGSLEVIQNLYMIYKGTPNGSNFSYAYADGSLNLSYLYSGQTWFRLIDTASRYGHLHLVRFFIKDKTDKGPPLDTIEYIYFMDDITLACLVLRMHRHRKLNKEIIKKFYITKEDLLHANLRLRVYST